MNPLTNIKNIYFIGIGGIGMSALARYFNTQGVFVSGYDKTPTSLTDDLQKEGIQIHFEDDINKIDKSATVVVYTPAIPASHSELNFCKENGYNVVKRSDVLNWITENAFTIAIAGTHGKTTTTSMTAHILRHTEFGCNAFLGGIATNYNTNFWSHEKNVVVVEADEYDRSFLKLAPNIAVVTAVDPDHLDIYGAAEQVLESFQLFTNQIQPNGFFIQKEGLSLQSKEKNATFGIEKGDFQAVNIRIQDHRMVFDMQYPGGKINEIPMRIPGFHNIENALAASALGMFAGLSPEEIHAGISTFKGVKRRFEYHLEEENHVMIDDYAHHPTEIEACLRSVKALYPGVTLTAVFQPHLFSRTRDFLDDFGKSLGLADEVYLLDIYPARELPIPGISSELVLEKIPHIHKQVISKTDLILRMNEKKPALLVTMGAGDIDLVLNDLKMALSS